MHPKHLLLAKDTGRPKGRRIPITQIRHQPIRKQEAATRTHGGGRVTQGRTARFHENGVLSIQEERR
jgi:hypothetical protein